MAVWVDPTARIPYVLMEDRGKPKDQQTTYFFRVMRASDHAKFSDAVVVDEGKITNWTRWRLALLRYTLVGWEGPGAPPFQVDDEGYPTDDCLSRLHYTYRDELATAADAANKITDDDASKSAAQ